MRFRFTTLAVPAAVLALSGLAQAATVKYPDGRTVKLAPKASTEPQSSGSVVITSDEGEESFTFTLRKNAVVRFEGAEQNDKGAKVLSFFLVKGGLEANMGERTRLATPGFWAVPEKPGVRVTFYAESFGVGTGYARNAAGSGLLRLLCEETAFWVGAEQGVTIERGRPGEVGFTTDTNNEWVKYRLSVQRILQPNGILLELNVPKATSGYIAPKRENDDPRGKLIAGKTFVRNQVSSWKSSGIRVGTYRSDNEIKSGVLAPGVPCTIDDATGGIEFGGAVAIEFSSLKAAVSLTSEFESLATSPLTRPRKERPNYLDNHNRDPNDPNSGVHPNH